MSAPACAVCAEVCDAGGILWETKSFVLRHAGSPFGACGWLMLCTKAHTAGAADFSDGEAASLGPALRAASAALLAATGALRVYTAALGEAHKHYHCHLVPRTADGPAGWALFAQQGEAAAGRVVVDAERVAEVSAAVKAALAGVCVD